MKKVINGEQVVEFYRGRHITQEGINCFNYYLKGEEVDGQFNKVEYAREAIDHDMMR